MTTETPASGAVPLGDTSQAPQRALWGPESASPGERRTPGPSCGTCGASWKGTRACHCGACHQTLSGLSLFDAHRSKAGGEHGSCVDPATLDGVEWRDGMWRSPEMTDEAKAKAFGGQR